MNYTPHIWEGDRRQPIPQRCGIPACGDSVALAMWRWSEASPCPTASCSREATDPLMVWMMGSQRGYGIPAEWSAPHFASLT